MKRLLSLILCLAPGAILLGQFGGELDMTFNATGSQFLSPGIIHDNINSVAIQSDQKIVGFGMTMGEGNFNFDLCIVRLLPDGSVDTSFGTDGYYTYDHAGESDFIYEGMILPDGRIWACGAVSNSADDTEIMLLRLNSDGTPDDTFGGGDGMAIQTINTGQDYANTMLLLNDGSIVIAGTTAVPGMLTTRGLIVKFNADGEIDTSYGFNGYSVLAYGTDSDVFQGLVEMPDGGLMLVGYSSVNFSNVGWICRVDSNGDLDTTFGTSGHYIYDNGSAAFMDIVYYATRHIVCGSRFLGTEDVLLIAIEADGTLSSNFGTSGEVVLDIDESDVANKILVDSQGGLIVAGSAGPSFFERNALALRLDGSGSLDSNFGNGGIFNQSFATNFDVIWGVAEQSDAKLILGGLASENDNNMLFVRINGAGTIDIEEPNDHSNLYVYPQPAQDELYFESKLPIRDVTIYSSTGQLVRIEKANQQPLRVRTSALPDGIYHVQVRHESGQTVSKQVIVAH
jgi:uncharacterized delta-60 repeat protein